MGRPTSPGETGLAVALVLVDTETGERTMSQVMPVSDERHLDRAAGMAHSIGAGGGKTSRAEVYSCRIEIMELLRSEEGKG